MIHRVKNQFGRNHQLALWGASILIVASAVGCGGKANFGGSSAAKKEAPAVPKPEPAALRSLTWYWQCEANPGAVPATDNSSLDLVVVGGGDHPVPGSRIRDTRLMFQGRLCPPEELKRDVVLVIDTSFSMSTNDPRILDSCARMDAARALLDSLPRGTSRYGIVTFNSGLATYATGLYSDRNLLFDDIAKGRTLADALCAAEGGTNYDAPLAQAKMLLNTGRADATKEVYFVSDGQPDLGLEGIAVAESLKNRGVKVGGQSFSATIATVMLSGIDTVLESKIASRDESGAALHVYAEDTSQLVSALTSLSANKLVSAEIAMTVGGESKPRVFDLLENATNLDFTLPSFTISGDEARQGISVDYTYRDQHGREFKSGGRLVWDESGDGVSPR